MCDMPQRPVGSAAGSERWLGQSVFNYTIPQSITSHPHLYCLLFPASLACYIPSFARIRHTTTRFIFTVLAGMTAKTLDHLILLATLSSQSDQD